MKKIVLAAAVLTAIAFSGALIFLNYSQGEASTNDTRLASLKQDNDHVTFPILQCNLSAKVVTNNLVLDKCSLKFQG